MMAPECYVYTGRAGETIPQHVTHILIIDEALNFIRSYAFNRHPNIEVLICHDGVEKIEEFAFSVCPSLRRVIMPGVKEIEERAFRNCTSLTYIECGKLEIIEEYAFSLCTSLSSIDLPSIKIVGDNAFTCCSNLTSVTFGKELVSIGEGAFCFCENLERVTMPLKIDMITDDNVFKGCKKLNHVDLVGGVHETVAALLLEEWQDDMNEEIDAINEILPNTPFGYLDVGEKTQAIQTWIRSVLRKFIHYKNEHRRILNEAAATLQLALPNDIVRKNVLTFLELPSYTFEGED